MSKGRSQPVAALCDQTDHAEGRCCRRRMQVGVLHWFARLWEIDQDEYWGYITNCGTEGNLHGILVGRENLPDGNYPSPNQHWPICSMWKAIRYLSSASRRFRFAAARDTLNLKFLPEAILNLPGLIPS